jgi:hypothetical protein
MVSGNCFERVGYLESRQLSEDIVKNANAGLSEACVAIERATAMRDVAIASAFNALAAHKPDLATALTANMGGSHKAARWMSSHQRAFDGKCAYQILAEGDEDRVWEQMERLLETRTA